MGLDNSRSDSPRIAIVHDWLVTYAGAEQVLEQMLNVFPDADVFSMVDFLEGPDRQKLKNKVVRTSLIQKLPFAKSRYRNYLPLMTLCVEQFDLTNYDIVISSSHAVAKGVLTGPDQLHICMCYSPARYAWDLQHQYLTEVNAVSGFKSLLMRWLLHKFRIWDCRTSNGVDEFIAISNFISRRISKVYGRDSTVIYPPVDTGQFSLQGGPRQEYYLTCSRMVPYKKIDVIAETFTQRFPGKELIVIGDGPDFNKVKLVSGNNVKLLGRLSQKELLSYVTKAKAFVFMAEEDFGIAPLEAQACGVPVIAYGKGGALETVVGIESAKPTGVFFTNQTVDSLAEAIEKFELNLALIKPENCRSNADRFDNDRFRTEFREFVNEKWQNL